MMTNLSSDPAPPRREPGLRRTSSGQGTAGVRRAGDFKVSPRLCGALGGNVAWIEVLRAVAPDGGFLLAEEGDVALVLLLGEGAGGGGGRAGYVDGGGGGGGGGGEGGEGVG